MDHGQIDGRAGADFRLVRKPGSAILQATLRRGPLALCAVLWLAALTASAVEPPLPPDDAPEILKSPQEWSSILSENSWGLAKARDHYVDASRQSLAGDVDGAIESLEAATLLDGSDPAPHSARAWLDLRRLDPTALGEWILSTQLSWMGYRHLGLTAVRVWIGLQLIVGVFALWFLGHLIFRYLPFWQHQIKSRFDRSGHPKKRYGTIWIALILIVAALPAFGLIPAVAIACLAVWPYTHRRARWTLGLLLLWFGAQGTFHQAGGPLLARLDPMSVPSLVMAARDEPATDALVARVARAREQDPENLDLLFADGLILARAGKFAQSNARFLQLLESRPSDPLATNNLASNHYYLGDVDRALSGFQRAVSLDADRGAIHHNLSQAYLRKLFMREGGESMQRAIQLGFIASQQSLALPRGAVYFAAPSDRELWALAWRDAERLEAVHLIASSPAMLGVSPGFAGPVLLGLVLLLPILSKVLPRPRLVYECANCKELCCARCSGEHDGLVLCGGCAHTARRAKSELVLATLLRNRRHEAERRAEKHWRRWNALLFGAGHLQDGMRKRGVISAIWLSIAVVALWSPEIPGLEPMGAAFKPDWPFRALAGVALFVLMLISWIGRVPLRARAFHVHPSSLISLGDLIEGRPRRRVST